ncbi:MAG: TonB-dependent receptor [Acidobacteria bacterium]|nr:TonB-dependent receptor [Acidobacteriota bacterium]
MESAYGRAALLAAPRLTVIAGARADFWTSTPAEAGAPAHAVNFFSPRVSAAWQASKSIAVRASATRASRTPTLDELHRSSRIGNSLQLGNPLLDPERLTGLEAGVTLLHTRTSMRATWFWNDLTQAITNITIGTTPTLVTRQKQNADNVRAQGLELDAFVQPTPRSSLNAFLNFDKGTSFERSIEFNENNKQNPGTIATAVLWPWTRASSQWAADFDDRTWSGGAGATLELVPNRVTLVADYTLSLATVDIAYGGYGVTSFDGTPFAPNSEFAFSSPAAYEAPSAAAALFTSRGATQHSAPYRPSTAIASSAVTLIFASASLPIRLAMTPARSSPWMRNPFLGPTAFHLLAFATLLNTAGSAGMKSNCPRRPSGKPEKASRLTPASLKTPSAFAASPGLSGTRRWK